MSTELFNAGLELITDIQFVGIKQEEDQICPLCKPGAHLNKVVSSGC
eukprot:CAMPEP_0114051916 /NCGR_PEP_ID=MMETSP1339-20121228/72578_1 /TAXON_ID=94617 /ORGANISM="Fibrocapsa japonica" /LENGTH=46 /assembly_acc=CAM_ASM_000762